VEFERKSIAVKDLILDVDNPRFRHLRELRGQKKITEEQIMDEIRQDDAYITLTRAIRQAGVTDPIWVKRNSGSKYVVVEGNRRTTILRDLLTEGVKPPDGIRYDFVTANVFAPGTTETELLLQRVRLQTGKARWDTFNTAMIIWELRNKSKLEVEDIAVETQNSETKVKETLVNVKLLTEYAKVTGDTDTHQYSYFQEAPKRVREWILANDKNKQTYFNLISPMKGHQRIRSVATKGGLREFALVLDKPDVLEKFLRDKEMTVEEAVDLVHEKDILIELPFIKKLGMLARQLGGLTDEQVERLQKEKKIVMNLKKLRNVCGSLVSKLDEDA
jgi:ParB-like nuclease family protein